MYSVSTDYKEQINKPLRNPSYIRVFLGIVNPDAVGSDTFSDNGHLHYSESQKIDLNLDVEKRYAVMEHNKFVLDGSLILPPTPEEENLYYQGFVADRISKLDRTFDVNPVLTIDFSQDLDFIGLTFSFDRLQHTYPTEMEIISYLDGVQVGAYTVYPNASQFVAENRIQASGLCDQIKLVFKKTSLPYRRIIIEQILFGITKEFLDNTVISASWEREIDLMSAKLPRNTFKFTALDLNKDYNPENADGIWKYMEARQPTTFEYGYELDDGTIEWITGGHLYTDGDIKSESEGSISKISFSLSSMLTQLTDTAYKGTYRTTPISMYQLALNVLQHANTPAIWDGTLGYYVDPSIADVTTRLPLPPVSFKEALQLIANASRAVLYTDRDGRINIRRLNGNILDFKLDFSNIKQAPSVEKIPMLATVETYYGVPQIDSSHSDIVSEAVSYVEPTQIRLTYPPATELTFKSTGVTVHGTPELYAESCIATVSGIGTVGVNGKKLNVSKTRVIHTVNSVGYNCPIENPLIDNYTDALAYAQWIASILTRRNLYTVNDRGYPELDILDKILADTLFSTNLEATVTYSKIDYNGALSGTTKYLTLEV